jgi:hypothetical protein
MDRISHPMTRQRSEEVNEENNPAMTNSARGGVRESYSRRMRKARTKEAAAGTESDPGKRFSQCGMIDRDNNFSHKQLIREQTERQYGIEA